MAIEDKRIEFIRGEIGLDSFCSFMQSFELSYLATQEAFEIFDINNDGKIELKEFLLVSSDYNNYHSSVCLFTIILFCTNTDINIP